MDGVVLEKERDKLKKTPKFLTCDLRWMVSCLPLEEPALLLEIGIKQSGALCKCLDLE